MESQTQRSNKQIKLIIRIKYDVKYVQPVNLTRKTQQQIILHKRGVIVT